MFPDFEEPNSYRPHFLVYHFLLLQLGPQSVHEKIIPLIFGIYRDIFNEAENFTVDHTAVHIRRTLKLSLFSFYNVSAEFHS